MASDVLMVDTPKPSLAAPDAPTHVPFIGMFKLNAHRFADIVVVDVQELVRTLATTGGFLGCSNALRSGNLAMF